MLKSFAIAVLSFFLSLYLVPKAIEIARKFNIMDVPDGRLKKHSKPVPYLGGVALYLSFLFPLSIVYDLNPEIVAILLSSTIILFVGFVDDLARISPGAKFMGELVAVWILVRAGVHIKIAALPQGVNYALTVLWLLTLINAFNFLDIRDGLAGGIGFFSALGLSSIAIYFREANTSMIGLALAGALLGFLLFNLPPAEIYMGDAGSLLLGFIIGAIAIIVDYTAINPIGYFIPIVVLWVVLFEIAFTFTVRVLKGRSPFKGSLDHFPLRLEKLLKSSEKSLVVILAMQFILSCGGFAMIFAGITTTVVVLISLAFVSLVFSFILYRKEAV